MRTVYISDDNHVFTNLEECKEYEAKLNGYDVEAVDVDVFGDGHFRQHLNNKQACQHFVANYIHQLLEGSFDTKEEFEEFFYKTKITVSHKGDKKSYLLIELIEEVPAHYKISSEKFHNLIR